MTLRAEADEAYDATITDNSAEELVALSTLAVEAVNAYEAAFDPGTDQVIEYDLSAGASGTFDIGGTDFDAAVTLPWNVTRDAFQAGLESLVWDNVAELIYEPVADLFTYGWLTLTETGTRVYELAFAKGFAQKVMTDLFAVDDTNIGGTMAVTNTPLGVVGANADVPAVSTNAVSRVTGSARATFTAETLTFQYNREATWPGLRVLGADGSTYFPVSNLTALGQMIATGVVT